jgi:uncharacterized protein
MEYFGKENSDGFTDFNAYLPFAVNGWFLNGEARCWVVSIGTQLPRPAEQTIQPGPDSTALTVKTTGRRNALQFMLKPEETENGSVKVEVHPGEPRAMPRDTNAPAPVPAEFFTVVVKRGGEELDRYENLTMNRDVATEVGDYVVTALAASE